MAIVHTAIFDAVVAIAGGYQSYTGVSARRGGASISAAIGQAAQDTLAALYPSQPVSMTARLAVDLAAIPESQAKTDGIELGRRAAHAILALRTNDGADYVEPRVGVDFFTSSDPGKWRQDPISLTPLALGAHWGEVSPFVLPSVTQFRAPAPRP